MTAREETRGGTALAEAPPEPRVNVLQYCLLAEGAYVLITDPGVEKLTGWTLQGAMFAAGDPGVAPPDPGWKPIYRFIDKDNWARHYYTPDREGAPGPDWKFEKLAWYAHLAVGDDARAAAREKVRLLAYQRSPEEYYYAISPSAVPPGYTRIDLDMGWVWPLRV